MPFWRSRPSTTDTLLKMIQDQQERSERLQEAQLIAMQGMVQSITDAAQAQSQVWQSYMQFFTQAPKPEVRVMQDFDEALNEEKRKALVLAADVERLSPAVPFDPSQWVADLEPFMTKMREEL